MRTTIAELMRRALGQGRSVEATSSERTGTPVVRLGTVITTEDVRALDDEL